MPSPLTESLVVHWPTTVRYHLHRLDLLAELKADDLLKAFQVTPERIRLPCTRGALSYS